MEKKKKKRVALLFKPVRVFLYSVETSSRMAEGPLFSVGNLIRRQELLYTTRVYFIYIGKVKEQREKGEKLTQAHDEQDEISMFAKKWNRRRRRKKTLFPREGRVLLSFEMSLNNSTPRWRQYVSGSNRSPFDLPLSLSPLARQCGETHACRQSPFASHTMSTSCCLFATPAAHLVALVAQHLLFRPLFPLRRK